MEQQYVIFERKNRARIGSDFEVIVDGFDEESGRYMGRTYMDAPEIDSAVLFPSKIALEPGRFVSVRITGTDGYDMTGELVMPTMED